ncbi:AzlC family ABC transporter permease [Alkalispirochaeta alkalica]|uniref:AzlC family ABC transporter permease n=1 Tax=Alkalispirochaeta alkalica TaxID=46356 RepID=UPI00038112FE|nr:AzlC family ABC transporter permease [Alkalispirochaeta alkalica]
MIQRANAPGRETASALGLFFSGAASALPIATGYIPVAITFGILVVNSGLSFLDAVLASALAFAGAAQFMAAGMYATAVSAAGALPGGLSLAAGLQIVLAGWLLNLRHLLMSSVVAPNVAGSPSLSRRSLLAFGLTDEVFGVATWRIAREGPLRPAFLLGLEAASYSAWVGGTALGASLGEVLPPSLRAAMGLALYALFAALLAGQVRSRRPGPVAGAAISGAALNVLLRGPLSLGPGAAFPLAMIGGALVGWYLSRPAGQGGGSSRNSSSAQSSFSGRNSFSSQKKEVLP